MLHASMPTIPTTTKVARTRLRTRAVVILISGFGVSSEIVGRVWKSSVG
jgi:hypothetical protein